MEDKKIVDLYWLRSESARNQNQVRQVLPHHRTQYSLQH